MSEWTVVLVLGLESTRTLLEHLRLQDVSGKSFCAAIAKLLKITFEWNLCVFHLFFWKNNKLCAHHYFVILLFMILLNSKLH